MGRTTCTEPQCLYNGALYLYVPYCKSYTSTPPMGRTACTEPQCLYNGALYLYEPYCKSYNFTPPTGCAACTEPQCLYSGALYLYVPYCKSYNSTPLWAVRPVQSLSACTTAHCTFTYHNVKAITLHPLWAVGLYRASVPVQGSTVTLSTLL